MKQKIIITLEKRKEKLRKMDVKEIGLFGSYLKNKQKRGSDIDFLVTFDKISSKNYFGLIFYLENLFKRKVDLVIKQDLKPELNYVKKEAIYVRI
jgi:uncharacterized protein